MQCAFSLQRFSCDLVASKKIIWVRSVDCMCVSLFCHFTGSCLFTCYCTSYTFYVGTLLVNREFGAAMIDSNPLRRLKCTSAFEIDNMISNCRFASSLKRVLQSYVHVNVWSSKCACNFCVMRLLCYLLSDFTYHQWAYHLADQCWNS